MLSLSSLIVSKLLLRRLFSLLCSRRRSCNWLTSCWCFCTTNTNSNVLCIMILWTYSTSHRLWGSCVKFKLTTEEADGEWAEPLCAPSLKQICEFPRSPAAHSPSQKPALVGSVSSLSPAAPFQNDAGVDVLPGQIEMFEFDLFYLIINLLKLDFTLSLIASFANTWQHNMMNYKYVENQRQILTLLAVNKMCSSNVSILQILQMWHKHTFFPCLDIVHGSYFQLCVDGHHLLKHISEHWRWGMARNRTLTSPLKPSLSLGFWGSRAAI